MSLRYLQLGFVKTAVVSVISLHNFGRTTDNDDDK